MRQLKLFDIESKRRPVNVACVRQRSPFRYPGGKTWFVPYAAVWLKQFQGQARYIEPFAGGAIVGLTCAFENLAKNITLVEIDNDIAAVWRTILSPRGKELAEAILRFEVNEKTVQAELSKPIQNEFDRAFITILKNRLQHGGILAEGAGMMKNGESGKGLTSRWYPKTLYQRIIDIYNIREKITFIQGDGLAAIRQNQKNPDAVFFIDPPYTVAGKRLYTYSSIDHFALFELADRIAGDFLMTYDDSQYIEALARNKGFDMERVPMKTTLHYEKNELVIGRNLDWLRRFLDE